MNPIASVPCAAPPCPDAPRVARSGPDDSSTLDGDRAMTSRLMVAFGAALLLVAPVGAQTYPALPTQLPYAPQGAPALIPDAEPHGVVLAETSAVGTERFWATGDYMLTWFRGAG